MKRKELSKSGISIMCIALVAGLMGCSNTNVETAVSEELVENMISEEISETLSPEEPNEEIDESSEIEIVVYSAEDVIKRCNFYDEEFYSQYKYYLTKEQFTALVIGANFDHISDEDLSYILDEFGISRDELSSLYKEAFNSLREIVRRSQAASSGAYHHSDIDYWENENGRIYEDELRALQAFNCKNFVISGDFDSELRTITRTCFQHESATQEEYDSIELYECYVLSLTSRNPEWKTSEELFMVGIMYVNRPAEKNYSNSELETAFDESFPFFDVFEDL